MRACPISHIFLFSAVGYTYIYFPLCIRQLIMILISNEFIKNKWNIKALYLRTATHSLSKTNFVGENSLSEIPSWIKKITIFRWIEFRDCRSILCITNSLLGNNCVSVYNSIDLKRIIHFLYLRNVLMKSKIICCVLTKFVDLQFISPSEKCSTIFLKKKQFHANSLLLLLYAKPHKISHAKLIQ